MPALRSPAVSGLSSVLDKLLPWRRRRVDVRVGVRGGTLPAAGSADAYFIAVSNASPKRPVTVTHVWLETAVKISVTTRPLPVTIAPGERWETWIDARELMPGTEGVERLARVALADDTIVRSR
jgi:hypothetical protein